MPLSLFTVNKPWLRFAVNEPWLKSAQGQYRAEYAGTSPLRSKPTTAGHHASATYTSPGVDHGENISALRRKRKTQLVKTTKIKELIDILEGKDKVQRESGPGPITDHV